VTTNVRTFLRDFSRLKAKAIQGETVKIQDRGQEFIFVAVGPAPRKSLLGSAQGKIAVRGDLTVPTLPDEAWQPSL